MKNILIFIVILIILIIPLVLFSRQDITGFVSADSKTQQLNIIIDKSQSFIMTSGNEEPYKLTSFRVSGKITGKGMAELYLVDSTTGRSILVYDNIRKKTSAMAAITGMVAGKKSVFLNQELDQLLLILPDKELDNIPSRKITGYEELEQGFFSSVCRDSCFIEIEMSKNNRYNLVAKVEPGTVMQITNVEYTKTS